MSVDTATLIDWLKRWADVRDRDFGGPHHFGETGTALLREAAAALASVASERDALTQALADASSWIENYPMSDRPDTKDDWRQVAAVARAALARVSVAEDTPLTEEVT